MEKHYFLINTTDNEYHSSNKYIAETYKEAEKVLLTGKYNDWWCSGTGNGAIVEVDKEFNTINNYKYVRGELIEINYKPVKK